MTTQTSQYYGDNVLGGTLRGYNALEKYHEGALSAQKELLIRNIAQDVAQSMRWRDDFESPPIDRVISVLKSKLPDPKFGNVSQISDHQRHICLAMAEAFNRRYGRQVIDTTADPNTVCERVSELVNTLFSSVKGEFLTVASDVQRTLRNLAILRKTLEASFEKLYNTVQLGSDDSAKLQSYGIEQLYRSLLVEIDRQMAILANLVDVSLDPTTRTIAELSDQDTSFRHFVKSTKASLGTEGLSLKLSNMLAGVKNIAILTNTIDNALKKIGHSVQEYRKYHDTPSLLNHLHEVFERPGHSVTSDELAKFVAVVQLIKNNDYAHDDIVEYLNSRAGKVRNAPRKEIKRAAGKRKKKVRGRGVGGADGENSLEKRIERQRKAREILFRDFEMRLETQYKAIFAAIEVLSKRLGNQVPIDDNLNQFVRCMEDLNQSGGVDRERYYLSLTGYHTDAGSKEERQRFLGQLGAVLNSLKPLMSGPAGEHFRTIYNAVERVVETIDTFRDTYLKSITSISVKPVGGAIAIDDADDDASSSSSEDEDSNKRADNIQTDELEETLEQGAEEALEFASDVAGGAANGERYEFVTLSQAIRHLQFFYNVARVKHNLDVASKDIKSYSKDYENIVGDAMGDRLIKLKASYERARKELEPSSTPRADDAHDAKLVDQWVNIKTTQSNVKTTQSNVPAIPTSSVDNTKPLFESWDKAKTYRKSVRDNALLYLKETTNVKIDLLKTLEAIDIYMANFADAIASNPQDIKDIHQLLKSVDTVAKWYTDKSANTIVDLFESTPSGLVDGEEVHIDDTKKFITTNDHYYEWVNGLIKNQRPVDNRLPANPFLGAMPGVNRDEDSYLQQILEKARKAANSVRVLDNIVSAFAKLGSQYGQLNLNNKTFMPPGVIFKNLRKYIYHSAIVMGFGDKSGNKKYDSSIKSNTTILETTASHANRDDVTHRNGSAIVVGTDGHDAHAAAPAARRSAGALLDDFKDNEYKDTAHFHEVENYMRGKFAVAFSSIYENGKPVSGFADTWYETDQFLIMAIKSMVAKVFTVIGTYGVFNRPLEKYKNLSSTRLILGGAVDIPEIIPGAIELYIRLPLLAEFYRELFSFRENVSVDASTDNKKITMVPEFDGVWENFVRIVFEDAKYVVEGTYSEHHVRSLIHEINDIYQKYRGSDGRSVVQDVISAFVAEINRRFGVIKQSEIDAFMKERRRYDVVDESYNPEERLDYNILDERNQTGRRPAPSDRYDHVFTTEERKIDNPFKFEYIKLVRDFRDNLDAKIKSMIPTGRNAQRVSFDQTVRTYKQQIDNTKSNDERYKIILKAMQGIDQLSNVNQHKAVMFHEAVVAPLNTLYSVWSTLYKFVRTSESFDLEEIWRLIDEQTVSGPRTYKAYFDRLQGARKGYERYLKTGNTPDGFATAVGGEKFEVPNWDRVPFNVNNVLVHRGTYGARTDVLWSDITAIAGTIGAATDDEKAAIKEGVRRFIVDSESMFKDMVNSCFAIAADLGDLAQVKVQQHNLLIEYGQLADHCQQLLDSVKKNLELFRGVVDSGVIRRVEGGMATNNQPDAGSIYFIEEYLIERLFKESRQTRPNGGINYGVGIMKTNEMLSRTFKGMAKSWNVLARFNYIGNARRVFAGPTGGDNPDSLEEGNKALMEYEKTLLRDSFERPMSELLYWGVSKDVQPQDANAGGTSKRVMPGGGAVSANPANLVTKHTMRQPIVHNKNINEWPFAVVPSIERLNSEDDDIKSLKALQDTIVALQNELVTSYQRALPNGNADSIFRWLSDGAVLAAGALGANTFGVEADPALITAQLRAVPAAAAIADHMKELATRHNSMVKQRERIMQTISTAPLDRRMKWYTDPSNVDEGTWFLGQLDPDSNENRAGVRDAPAAHPDIKGGQFDAGLLVRLNEILSKYLYTGWDPTTKKIYSGLINKFASGSHVSAVSKGQAINDVDDVWYDIEMTGTTGILGAPAAHTTVFASLARAMRNIMNNTRKTGLPEFRTDSMMELPIHVKETMRGALPHFDKLFKLVIKKAELLRQIAQQVSLVRQLPYAVKYGVNPAHSITVNHVNPVYQGLNGSQAFTDIGVDVANLIGLTGGFPVALGAIPLAAAYGTVAGTSQVAIIAAMGAGATRSTAPETAVTGAAAAAAFRSFLACRANFALLDSKDVMHVPTGFVIRNASNNMLKWVDSIIAASNCNTMYQNGVAPATYCEWIRGAAHVNAPLREGERYTTAYGNRVANRKSDSTLYTGFAPYVDMDEASSKRWHTELIDSIANMAISLSKCAADTYKELADEPKFLETHEGFITDYVNMNKNQPIMLLSQLQIALRPRWRSDPRNTNINGGEWDIASKEGYAQPNFMLPLYRSGETPFKLAYGSRLVLGRPDVKPTLEFMPGMDGLLERYNGVTTGDARIDKSNFERFCVNHAALLRYIVDLKHYRAVLDTGASGRLYEPLWITAPLQAAPPGSDLFDAPLDIAEVTKTDASYRQVTDAHMVDKNLRSYPFRCTLEEDISITENSDQDDTLRNITSTVVNQPTPIRSRDQARVWNILDLNIVPINLHALMREIPLVNVINYSYTCDRMIQDALIPEIDLSNTQRGHVIPQDFEVGNSAQMLAKILIYPYAKVSNKEFYGYMTRLATGDSGLDLGRPKFISDQLWNKLLLQELYTRPIAPVRGIRRPDESGPAADNAQRRALRAYRDDPSRLRDLMFRANDASIRPVMLTVDGNAGSAALPQNPSRTDAQGVIERLVGRFNGLAGQPLLDAGLRDNATAIAYAQAMVSVCLALNGQNNAQVRQTIANAHDPLGHLSRFIGINAGAGYVQAQVACIAALLYVMIEQQLQTGAEVEMFDNNGVLSYPSKDNDDRTIVKQVDLTGNTNNQSGTAVRSDLAAIGRMRFDTTFVRNLFFLINLQRVMRMIIRDEVSYLESPVVTSSQVINREITEFESNEVYDADVYHN